MTVFLTKDWQLWNNLELEHLGKKKRKIFLWKLKILSKNK